MSEEVKTERRREPRVHSLNLVNTAQFDPKGFFSDLSVGRTVDISHRGIRLELSHALPLRSTVTLSLALGSELVEVQGMVCHLEVVDATTCSMGVEFTELSSAARQVLDQYIQDHSQ